MTSRNTLAQAFTLCLNFALKKSTLVYSEEDAFEITLCGNITESIKEKFLDSVVSTRLKVINSEWFKNEGMYEDWVDEGWSLLKKDWPV